MALFPAPDHGKARLSGVGLLVFTVLVVVLLFRVLGPDEHPLALQRNVDLCAALGDEVWTALGPAGAQGAGRQPEGNPENRSICEYTAGAAPAPGGAAARPLARVMLTTEADLRYQNLGQSLGRHMTQFVSEMKASGWEALEIEGPWRRTYAFSGPGDETVLLIEDEGVFLWVSSTEVALEPLKTLALAVTERLRSDS